MNTRISDAALESFDRAYTHAWRESTISFPGRTVSFHVREANRAALEAALPHLQPAKPEAVRLRDELREWVAAFEDWYVQNAFDYASAPLGSRDCALSRKAWQAALASVQPKQFQHVKQVAEHFNMAVTPEQMAEAIAGMPSELCSKESAHAAFGHLASVQPSPAGHAVDLAQFRESIQLWRERIRHDLANISRRLPMREMEQRLSCMSSELRDCKALLALIDSGKAVQS